MSIPAFSFRPIPDVDFLSRFLLRRWGTDVLAMGGRVYRLADVEAMGAYDAEDGLVGVAVYAMKPTALFLLSLDALRQNEGVASRMIEALSGEGRRRGARRLRVMTTNVNYDGMRFYQRRGFRMTALYPGAIDALRAFAPTLKTSGADGVPARDILELEIDL
jgi:GNAT superfamily N-acetyltransferase